MPDTKTVDIKIVLVGYFAFMFEDPSWSNRYDNCKITKTNRKIKSTHDFEIYSKAGVDTLMRLLMTEGVQSVEITDNDLTVNFVISDRFPEAGITDLVLEIVDNPDVHKIALHITVND